MFARALADGRAVWFSLPGGAPLFESGEDAEQFYILRAGRLGAYRREEGSQPQFLGVVRPGEPVGEMALIAGYPHTATVVALRDSEVLALDRADFFEAAESDPAFMTELARLAILRSRQAFVDRDAAGGPSVFAFVSLSPRLELRSLVTRLRERLSDFGYRAASVGSEAMRAPTEWFSNVERDNDFVLYVAEADEVGWSHLIARQGDRVVQVVHADDAPPPTASDVPPDPMQAQRLTDLVLIQPADRAEPLGTEAWLEALAPERHFHLRPAHDPDLDRLARVVSGRSVGLVLSGGGARAYAHVGAIRALQEHRAPIDFLGGVSMGAIIGAGVAMGWQDAELERRIRKAFVETSPLDDISLPILAMTRGDKVRDRLAEHFGERTIGDLWLPFFCLSTNLTTAASQMHRRGLVREALRASVSLPGVLPPVTSGKDVLVDGAVLKNFPADIMRSIQAGPIVGVDVGRGRSIEADDVRPPASLWQWLASGEWRRGPPIVSVLIRSATIRGEPELTMAHAAADVLVEPVVDAIEIRDWKAFDVAVDAGYRATCEVLERLNRPITDLRLPKKSAERPRTSNPSG